MPHDYKAQSRWFKAMAHPIRLQILNMLRQDEVCVCHMEAALKKRQAYISQQLMVLREAGLVESRKDGLQVFYRLVDPVVRTVLNEVFGPQGEAVEQYTDCPCPACTTIPISKI